MSAWFITPFFLHLIDWTYDECYHAARFEKDSRYYVIRLSKDLLEDWVIILTNGRIKSKLGQSRTLAFSDFGEGLTHFCVLAKLRYQRGYQIKTIACDNPLTLSILPYFIGDQRTFEFFDDKTSKKINRRERRALKPVPILNNQMPQQLGFLF